MSKYVDYEDITSEIENTIEFMANVQAAMAWSTPSDEEEDGAIIVADFGGEIAVNGDWEGLPGVKLPEPYKMDGYRLSNRGGRVPTTEEEISMDFVIEAVARELKVNKDRVRRAARQAGYEGDYVYTSVGGETEVWVPEDVDDY